MRFATDALYHMNLFCYGITFQNSEIISKVCVVVIYNHICEDVNNSINSTKKPFSPSRSVEWYFCKTFAVKISINNTSCVKVHQFLYFVSKL